MKIKTLIIVLLLFTVTSGFAQNSKIFRIGTFGQIVCLSNEIMPQFGLSAELFVTDNLSLNYKYSFGQRMDGEFNAHINPSIVLLSFAYSFEAILGVLLIPEGISYHFYISDYYEIAPYINLLSAEVNLFEDRLFVMSSSIGLNAYFKNSTPINNIILGLNGGAMVIYSGKQVLPVFGVSINYQFN